MDTRAVLSFALALSLLLDQIGQTQEKSPTPAQRPGTTSAKKKTEPTPAAKPSNAASSPSKAKASVVSTSKPQTVTPPNNGQYRLRYSMSPNTKIVSEVTHLAKTNTKINDVEQMSQSRTVSRKVWTVTSVEPNGNMTFVHQVESVDMSQQVGDEEEIRYNSKTDTEPAEIFKSVASTIGTPIATVTITATGQVVERSDIPIGINLGMGDITIPLPDEAVSIGAQWETSREIRIRRTDGTPKAIKIHELYTLEKVSAGVAVISIRSEPLTPINAPEMEAQVIQQMSNGTLRFDLDAGRLISKSLAWDKSVVGFSGPGSVMDYAARLDEVVQKN